MDLRIAISNKMVQEILAKVSKADKRIFVQEAILHYNDQILKGNARSVVYDPLQTTEEIDKKENIQQEKQSEITEGVEEQFEITEEIEENDDIFNFTIDLSKINLGGENEDGHKDEYK